MSGWDMHGRGVHGRVCMAGCAWQGSCVAGGNTWHTVGGTHPTGMHSCFSINITGVPNLGGGGGGGGYIFSAQICALLPVDKKT